MALIHRLSPKSGPAIAFRVDGVACEGWPGDTLLTAILSQGEVLRRSDFSREPRAGFCQMGACQDCWVLLAEGGKVRACTTPLAAGMSVLTGWEETP
ncbi:(2Fe-2S)-binding protein [Bosea sp. (in: a-proteobacteria)]|jgi:predicted molibdopterin-dependent oxidoreductase YjgC|uniref:(2Fe-2S)-binding protein n=1 Tax=Bosea sp. (in: a-proteobacteria) TaxID=1871050 RepID=UPI003F720B42